MQASILIVDDEEGIRESLGALLRDEGYDVDAVASGEECLERLDRRNFDLVAQHRYHLRNISGDNRSKYLEFR